MHRATVARRRGRRSGLIAGGWVSEIMM